MLTALTLSAVWLCTSNQTTNASKPKADFSRKAEISCYTNSKRPYPGGNGTASGKKFNNFRGFTAATRYVGWVTNKKGKRVYSKRPILPFGTCVEIWGDRIFCVEITDTGSYMPKRASSWFDLNYNAWDYGFESSPSRFVRPWRIVSKEYFKAWLETVKNE